MNKTDDILLDADIKVMGTEVNSEQVNPSVKIISVKYLITDASLTIPEYQRPYKWSIKNVNDLLNDIQLFKTKPAYRLGTIVFHQEKLNKEGEKVLKNNIVDGQQRTITLLLIALGIQNSERLKKELKEKNIHLPELKCLDQLKFKSDVSKNNIRENYLEIQRRITDFNAEMVSFFYEKCEVVRVVLSDVSEAFQFFDSQNARGVDLNPHDLLKAFHLREMMGNNSENERIAIVEGWEDMELDELKHTFSNYLFRIRNWSNGYSARHFTKNDVAIFKGISPGIKEPYPFANMYRINHYYIEAYNQDFNRKIDQNKLSYPFQLDQVVINGKRFFEMISHYVKTIKEIKFSVAKEGTAKEILKVIANYEGMHRTGDKYVRNLFDCALIYYMDKFGEVEIERAIERIFIWAYTVRLTQHSVQLATVDNYALQNPQVFKTIKNALQPNQFLSIKLKVLDGPILSTKTDQITKLFKTLNYIL
jgi:Protein of unknown function DUF262